MAETTLHKLSEIELRELICNIIENVDDASEVAIKFVEDRQLSVRNWQRSMSVNDLERVRIFQICFQLTLKVPCGSVSQSSEDVKGKINGHVFQSHKYMTPTYCAHCRKLLKGIIKQVSPHSPLFQSRPSFEQGTRSLTARDSSARAVFSMLTNAVFHTWRSARGDASQSSPGEALAFLF